jgi:hypothetical protein
MQIVSEFVVREKGRPQKFMKIKGIEPRFVES